MQAHMNNGLNYEAALSATIEETKLPHETIEYHCRRQNRVENQALADARAINVLRLAAKGCKNTEIAAQIGIHPNSVSRVISR